jgi:hypothetical protein
LGTGAKDKNGNALAAAYVFTFTTASAPDTTPPTIASTTPTTTVGGTTVGVAQSTTTITVNFSEAMNKAAAQTAFQISSPSGLNGGLFNWPTATSMVYTIPGAPLAYGTTVTFQVTNTATDLAGNALDAASTGNRNFRLRRQSTLNLYSCGTSSACVPTVPSGYIYSNATCSGTTVVYSPNTIAPFGDSSSNYIYRSYVNFDLSPLVSKLYPSLAINSATLAMYQDLCSGNPYSKAMGNYVAAFQADYGTTITAADCELVPGPGSIFRSTVITSNVWKSANVTTQVTNQWANRLTLGNRSQFLVRMSTAASDNNNTLDYCRFATHTNGTAANRPYLAVTFEYN